MNYTVTTYQCNFVDVYIKCVLICTGKFKYQYKDIYISININIKILI